ncbi:hypothetical protein [Dactylosporangium sp. CA-092794]|uniref:hypothetical protein n=1 Tax=Dactylosporangium sp. CA-092794 TaxID=3239929 RepID=UPI003D8EFA44
MPEPVDPEQIDRDHPVGRTGQTGRVYRQDGERLYKEYRRRPVDGAHLDRLIRWREGLLPDDAAYLDAHCAWPLRRVGRGAETHGYLMNAAPDDFWAGSGGERRVAELGDLIRPPAGGGGPVGPADRLRLVRDLAELLEFFARHELVHGDLGETTLLWTLRGRPRVFVIDCDDVRLGAVRVPAEYIAVPRGEWHDPGLDLRDQPDVNSDRRALALVCYRAFYGATAPAARPALPRDAVRLPDLELLTLEGLRRRERPSATRWLSALDAALDRLPSRPASASPGPGPGPRAPRWRRPASPVPGAGPQQPRRRPGPPVPGPGPHRPRWRRPALLTGAGAAAALLGFGAVAALAGGPPPAATPVLPFVLPTPSDTRLEQAETRWSRGSVQISVRHYFAAVEGGQTASVPSGWVSLRVSIRNDGPARLDLSTGPDSLVLITPVDPTGFNAPGVARESSFVTPDGLRLYTIGFQARRRGLAHDHTPYDAGWDAPALPGYGSFDVHDMGKDSAVYLVPPPTGAGAQSAGPLDPRSLHIAGVGWVENRDVKGFTPVESWIGPNTFESFSAD